MGKKGEQEPAKGDVLKNGKTILTANSREELFAMFKELKASHADVTLAAGPVGEHEDGTFALQVNIV